jgi:hypothetical protein
MNIEKFLELIRNLESSGGKNVNHKPTASGKLAIGEYGQMPDTIRELANRARLGKENNMMDDSMVKGSDEYVSQSLAKSPEIRNKYAGQMAKMLLDKTGGDMELAATGWLYGHNHNVDALKKKLENDPEYRKRIQLNMPKEREPAIEPEQKEYDFMNLKNILRGTSGIPGK